MKPVIYITFILILVGCTSPQAGPPRVEAFYPSSDSLPENLLRVYVQFTTPMKVNVNEQRVKLYTAEGQEVADALLNMAHELWSPDQTQWTLLFDPARVKTGLVAHERLGRALVPGQTYRLVIEGMEDIHHRRMEQVFVKTIHAIEADTTPPATERWEVEAPEAKSRDPLVVRFPQMLDQFSVQQRLIVTTRDEEPVSGHATLERHETQWLFIPENPWQEGEYILFANTRLADPSGNNLNGLFDHESGSLNYEKEGQTIRLPLTVK